MLLQLLQEASSLSIADAKKALQKDKRGAQIFKKDLTLADIQDPESFLATIKYYILNNENIKNFVALRHNVRDLDKETLAKYRSMRGKDLDEKNLKWLKEFIVDLFKEHSSVERGTMSPDLRKQLKDWFNSNGRYFNLPAWAQRELMAIPSLRPDKRVLLYRGVLFKDYDLKTDKNYDGTMREGNGIKFLKSIKKGSREVDLSWDRPSSWSKSKDVADRFAKYGPASSSFSATLQWLERGMNQIDGALGFVISTFANPDDILVDTSRLGGVEMQHGDEAEVILKPGTYTARVVKKYTVKGEVDFDAPEGEENSKIKTAVEKAKEHSSKINSADEHADLIKYDRWKVYDPTGLLTDASKFKKLVMDSTTTAVMHDVEKLLAFYNDHLHDISDDDVRADALIDNDELRKDVQELKEFLRMMRNKVRHGKFKSDKNPRAEGKIHDLSAEEYRATISSSEISALEKDLLTYGKLTSRESSRAFSNLAKFAGVDLPSSAQFHMFGAPKQKPIIDETMKKFLERLGLDASEETQDNTKRVLNLLRKAFRNYQLLDTLQSAKKYLQGNKNEVQ